MFTGFWIHDDGSISHGLVRKMVNILKMSRMRKCKNAFVILPLYFFEKWIAWKVDSLCENISRKFKPRFGHKVSLTIEVQQCFRQSFWIRACVQCKSNSCNQYYTCWWLNNSIWLDICRHNDDQVWVPYINRKENILNFAQTKMVTTLSILI